MPKYKTQQLLKIPEVARLLGLHRRTVLTYIHSGALPAINVSSGQSLAHYRVSDSDLAKFIDDRRVKP